MYAPAMYALSVLTVCIMCRGLCVGNRRKIVRPDLDPPPPHPPHSYLLHIAVLYIHIHMPLTLVQPTLNIEPYRHWKSNNHTPTT